VSEAARNPATDLRALIDRWDRLVVATSDDPPETFLKPPATQADIAALEARLGTPLPPSYRAFLAISNGADAFPIWGSVNQASVLTSPTGLRDAATVDWIRNGDRSMIVIWTAPDMVWWEVDPEDHPFYARLVPEREYLLPEIGEHPEGGGEKGGHLRNVLEVSTCIDGYATYLNPLVVDADGEWEAWDFGTKTLGAVRYRSFRALIEADIAQLEKRIATGKAEDAEVDRRLTELEDRGRAPDERIRAAYALFYRDDFRDRVVDILSEMAVDEGLELGARQSAMQVLGYTRTTAAIATLARLATEPEPRIRVSVTPPLAASSEPVALEATRALLTDPATPDYAFGSIYACNEAVWDAWQATRDPRLLAALGRCRDERSIEPIVAALGDPGLAKPDRDELISTAGLWLRDVRLVPALVTAAGFGGPYDRIQVARSLETLGAIDEAVALLREVATELGPDGRGAAESALGLIPDPAAGDALVEMVAAAPTALAVDALAWHPSPAAAALIEPLLDDPDMHLAGIDALETMHLPQATDVLARRSAAGDLIATRALARLRDDRALAPLVALLVDPDPAAAFRGADGLRDLRDPRATDALLAAVDHPDPDVAVCATHALISMASPRTPEALERLAANPDDRARGLASDWRSTWSRRSA
jgi:HEAT repeat protein